MKMLTALLTASIVFSVTAETHITGDISGMTIDETGNPYIIEQDIMIPEGKKLVIKEGCVFLFKPFTGFTVQGQLSVEGSQEKNVIFSSINDGDLNRASEQLPNPFDWNGILVMRESGSVTFKNIALRFSVYGIKSQNPNIQIINGIFRQNGQFHFTINDKIQFVQDNIPYSFAGSDDIGSTNNKTTVPTKPQDDTQSNKRIIVRYVSLGVGVAGAVTGIVFGAQIPGAWNDWAEAGGDQYKKKEDTFYSKVVGTCIGGGIGVIGLTIFGFSFR